MVTSGNTRSHREKLLQTSILVWLQFVKTDPGPESIKCRETTNDNMNKTRGSGTMPPSKQDLHDGRLTFCDLEETRLRFVLVRSASLNHEVSDPTRGFLTLPNHKRTLRSRRQPQPRSFWLYQGDFWHYPTTRDLRGHEALRWSLVHRGYKL